MSPTRDGIELSLSGVPGRFITAVALAVAAMAPGAFAQAITPLDTLVANHGSVHVRAAQDSVRPLVDLVENEQIELLTR